MLNAGYHSNQPVTNDECFFKTLKKEKSIRRKLTGKKVHDFLLRCKFYR